MSKRRSGGNGNIDGTSNSLTAEDGFTVLAVTEAICRSSKDGNWERPVRLRT